MKMKKLVALITAGALCLGMSLTAFAADTTKVPSPDETVGPGNGSTTDETDHKKDLAEHNAGLPDLGLVEDDNTIAFMLDTAKDDLTDEQYKEVVDTLTDKTGKKIKDVLSTVYNLPANAEVVVLGAADLRYGEYRDGEWVDFALPKEGLDREFKVGSVSKEGYKDGDKIYVLHYVDGKWQVLEGTVTTVGDDAYIKVHFDSLSPVAFIKVTSSGKIIALDKKGEPVAKVTSKSPKTGEF